jgi:hypothetical protein
MGGTTGTSTQTPGGGAEQAAVNPSLNWPEWASNFAAANPPSPMATAADGSVPDQGPLSAFGATSNLGFPSLSPTATPVSAEGMMDPTGFNSQPYLPSLSAGTDPVHLNAGAAPVAPTNPAADAGLTSATGPNAPVTQAQLQQEFDQPRNPIYEDTQVSAYTLPGGTYGTTGVQSPSAYAPGVGYVDPQAYATFGQGMGPYVDPRLDPYYAASWDKSQGSSLTPGAVLTPEQAANTPHMSKALYDFNMNAYGNPYGPAQAQADKELYARLLRQYGPQSASEMALGGGGNVGGGA